MAVAVTDFSDDPRWFSTSELGEAVAAFAMRSAAAESRWLGMLVEFDLRRGWYDDGQLSAAEWLVWRCGMSARTARDKLRVAHELRRRPLLAEAFSAGRVSYCKVRAITRIVDADDELDEWLLRLADAGTVADLDRAVRHWQVRAAQQRGVDDYLRRYDRRGVRASRTYDGMVVMEVVLPVEEGEEALAALDACGQGEDSGSREPAKRRADALMTALRGKTAGSSRYTLNLVADVDVVADRFGLRAELLDGSPLPSETLRRLSCDCGVVRHLVRGRSRPLDVGARTPVWTAAQRRAVEVRDGGRCRFVACERRTCDVHHVVHYAEGGPTTVHNGLLLCPRHHTAVHELGFRVSGEPNGRITFHRPDGRVLGSTTPRRNPGTDGEQRSPGGWGCP